MLGDDSGRISTFLSGGEAKAHLVPEDPSNPGMGGLELELWIDITREEKGRRERGTCHCGFSFSL